MRKKGSKVDNNEIFDKIISTGVTYYKYFAIMVNSEEKYYVSTFQECENIIANLKEKNSDNIDKISYVVKYETGLQNFTDVDSVVAGLYVEKPKKPVYSPSTKAGSVETRSNISYAKLDLGVSFMNPVSGRITSRFGVLSSIRSSYHTGLDISGSIGTPIMAAASGTVAYSGRKSAFGNLITIDHGNGVVTYYAHCNALYKSVGEYVNQGDVIASIGMTGNTTGPHLHLEVRVNGIAHNPTDYFNY